MISMLCSVQAQSTFGIIVGVVKDPGERVVPGAEIKLSSLDDESARTTTSDADGTFQFMNVKAGRYEIGVHSTGIASLKLQSVQLVARQTLREEISLKVASASEIIDVGDTAAFW